MGGSRVLWRTWCVAWTASICFGAALFAQPDFKVIHSFDGTDGDGPYAKPHQSADGFFYGTAYTGGEGFVGTVFRMDADGKRFKVLHEFNGDDGKYISSSLVEPIPPDGYLYGTACAGGVENGGTVFRVAAAGNDFEVLHDFLKATDGWFLCSTLAPGLDGRLYGTASQGGAHGFGTIFGLNTDGSNFGVILHCGLDDCAYPSWGVIQGSDGFLYGTRYNNVMLPTASVFRLSIDGGDFLTIYPGFSSYPTALFQASDGLLYGAVQENLFRMDTSGGNYLARFGVGVNAVIEGADGRIYGSNVAGGQHYEGTIFRLNYDEDVFPEVLRDCADDAWAPASPPIQGADGAMFGATPRGGDRDLGAVYRMTLVPTYTITPSAGPAAGGTSAEVYAWNFDAGATLRIGGVVPNDVVVNAANRTITATTPAFPPGTLQDVQIFNSDGTFGTGRGLWMADFLDVPASDPFHWAVERIFRAGVTAGCGGGVYCGNGVVRRDQMAVFLLKAEHGSDYIPPPCEGLFSDVSCGPTPSFAADWIEQLFREEITSGCGGGNFCPGQPVTRAQMAVFLLRTLYGPGITMPPCVGVFFDVPCGPVPGFAVDWIEELYHENITGGCAINPMKYCPDEPVLRKQMAALLVNTFPFTL
jgi:uncharacterized repeat protein (TIGR03803 family)